MVLFLKEEKYNGLSSGFCPENSITEINEGCGTLLKENNFISTPSTLGSDENIYMGISNIHNFSKSFAFF